MTYHGNIGIMEMIKFSQVATAEEQARMDRAVAQENWTEYKSLVAEVIGVELK
jgi:hypothetical protein